MKDPRVSVVIPAYNHEKYVGEAIQSVLDQTFQDWELIIINDGSTDNTEAEILKFKDHRIRYYSQENRGLSATLNRGIKLAGGEFFNFLPSDDAFFREKLEVQLKVFEGNLDLGVVFAFPQLIDAQGKEIYDDPAALWPIVPHETKEEIFPALFERNFLSAPSAFIRMDCLKKVGGFDESLKYAQDYDLWLRILKYYDAQLLKQPLIRYRWHGKNLTFQATPETESEKSKILLKAFKELSIEEIFPSLRKEQDRSAFAQAYEKLAAYVERSGVPAQIAISQIYRELGRSLESFPPLLPSGREKREMKETPFEVQERSSQKIHIVMETLTLDKGGLEQVIYNLAKGLSPNLFRIVIVVIEKGGVIAHQCESMGIPVEILKYDKAREYKEILERYQIDLVVSHYSTFGAKLAFEKGIPTLAVIHNTYSWPPDNVLSNFKSADPFVSGYIAVSEEVKQYTHYRFNISLEKITVIPNGIDAEEYISRKSSQTIHRSDLGLGDGDYVFINIASIVPNKGQNVILAALDKVVKEYPKIKVLSFGSILSEPYFQFLKEWIERKNLSEHFKMVGFVEDVRHYFQIADAFLSTSFIEGWPLSVMEAMLYELPVIATQAGGVKEILGTDGSGIILRNSYDDFRGLDMSGLDQLSRETSPLNAAEVAQAMKRFYDERDYWKKRGKKGFERIFKHFSLQGMVRSYERELFSLYIAMEKSRGHRPLRKIQEQAKPRHENQKSTEYLRSPFTQSQQRVDSKIDLLESKTDSTHKHALDAILKENEDIKGIIVDAPAMEWNVPLLQRPHHLALQMAAKGYLYFYCTDNRHFDKISGFEKITDRCYVTDQHDLIVQSDLPFIYHLNSICPGKIDSDIFERINENHITIYDYIDPIHEYISGTAAEFIYKRHMSINPDIITCTARVLADEMLQRFPSDKVYYLPNAAEYEHFHIKKEVVDLPEEIKHIVNRNKPIIGYSGALAKWIDYNLINLLAEKRPDAEIILIGWDFDGSQKLLKERANLHILGARPYAMLPKYAIWFDIAIIPFGDVDISHSTSPIKMYEYMALGKPIVTTDVFECKRYRSVMAAQDHNEFLLLVERAFKLKDDEAYLKLLDDEAKGNTWEARASELEKAIGLRHQRVDNMGYGLRYIKEPLVAREPNDKQPLFLKRSEILEGEKVDRGSSKYDGPMVSIIIPTCDRPDFLKEALQSVLSQTYKNFEIIVINDGGKDVSEIINSFGNIAEIIYLRHEEGRGPSAARNTGLKQARGKYIAYLDDDDIYYPNHLETLVLFLEGNNYKVAYTDSYQAFQIWTTDGYVTIDKKIKYNFDFIRQHFLVGNYIHIISIVHKRELLDEVGLFDEGLETHEDWDMCIRLSQKYDFYHIKAATAEFRTRDDMSSATNIKRADFLRTLKLIHERYSHLVTDPRMLEAQKIVEEAMTREVEIKQMSSSTMEYGRLHQYRFAKEFVKGKRVLVLGGDKGYGSFILSEDAESVICIDKDERNIRYASSNYIKENLEFIKGSLIDVPVEEEKTFDVIVCFEALGQIEEHHELMKEVKRLLKDDGIFISSSSNKYVSSDQTAYEKLLRLKELSFDEFKSLLEENFRNTLIYGQKVYPSSNIFPLFKSSATTRDYTIEKGDKTFLFVPHERKEARYLIAVSSDGHIKDITGNSYLVDISETLFKWKDGQIRNLEAAIREKDVHIANLEAAIKERDVRTGNLETVIKEKDAHIADLEAAIKERDVHTGNLETVIKEKDAHIADLEAAIKEWDVHISNLETVMGDKESHMSNLEATLRDRNTHLTHLEAAIKEKQAALNDIYNSHGWKALQVYYSVRNKIFPIDTKRGLFGKILFKLITNPKGFFKKKITSLSPITKQTQSQNSKEENDIAASVIIVNYKNERLTVDCVKSLLSNDYPNSKYEVVLVDNGSTNYSYGLLAKELGIYRNVTILKSEKNIGFGSGCNIGIRASRGKYVILLNNDALVPKDWLDKFIEYAELNKDIGIFGTKLLFANQGKVINNAGSYLTVKGDAGDIGFRENDIRQYDYQREVFSICGANMLIKRAVLNNIGLFDNKFFLYYEDSDLCYRARLKGYKILYLPEPSVLHQHAASSGEWSPLFSFHVFRSRLFLHLKNSSMRFLITVFICYLKQLFKEIIILKSNRRIHAKVILSVIRNLPYLVNERLKIRLFMREVGNNSICKYLERIPGRREDASRVKDIIIYNRYLDTLGGGEFSTILLAKALSELFTNAKINIVTFDKDKANWGKVKVHSTMELEEAFSTKLCNRVHVNRIKTRIQSIIESLENSSEESSRILYGLFYKLHRVLLHRKLERMSKKCDLFINHSFMDEFIPRANVNLYFCMFPHVCRNEDFIINYNKVIGISEFTIKHINQRWECKGELLYPFGLERIPNYNDFDRRENIIVSVGRFFREGHNKRQDIIIEAFKKLKQRYELDGWKLILIGRYSERDIDFVKELKVASRGYEVIILTDLSENDKSSLLEKCKIYVHATGYGLSEEDFPDLMEHFGISVVEAKIKGLVPIVVNQGGLKELVKDGVDGFRFNTIDDLVEKLYMIIKNQDLLQKLSLNAYKNSIKRFNYSIFSGHFKLILKDMFRFKNE